MLRRKVTEACYCCCFVAEEALEAGSSLRHLIWTSFWR